MTKAQQTEGWKLIQEKVGAFPDGSPGSETVSKVYFSLFGVELVIPEFIQCKATSFADPADVRAFLKCKKEGRTDEDCFNVGDNGIGYWEDVTAQEDTPMVALPPPIIREKWGTLAKGKHAKVEVHCLANDRKVIAIVADTMPSKPKNGAGIDLNPATVKALGLRPPLETQVRWTWV